MEIVTVKDKMTRKVVMLETGEVERLDAMLQFLLYEANDALQKYDAKLIRKFHQLNTQI